MFLIKWLKAKAVKALNQGSKSRVLFDVFPTNHTFLACSNAFILKSLYQFMNWRKENFRTTHQKNVLPHLNKKESWQ